MTTLKELRAAHVPPLTQEGLARESGLSLAGVQRIERNGPMSASISSLVKIARVFGTTVDALVKDEA